MIRRPFLPVAGSERVFRLEDGCAVYLLRDADRGLLIDLGAGAALRTLGDPGVQEIEGVLFTHAHRDQCAGATKAIAADIPLRFPEATRGFVEEEGRSDLGGGRAQGSPLQRTYPGRFMPPRPISGARFDLRPGTTLSWGRFEIEIVAIPGHIDHQVAFLVDEGERRFAFCGDAIHSPGKLHEPYHLETDHYTGAGARAAAESLRVLMQLRPNVLCPSHGPVTQGALWPVFEETITRLHRLAALKDTICPGRPAVPRLVPAKSGALMPLSPHLYVWNNSYFLLSDDGPALMVDNAGALPEDFWQQWQALPGGPRPIEVVLVTHIHCDHVEGIDALRASEAKRGDGRPPLQAWAHEAIADAIESPHWWRRPWLAEQGTRVDRRLSEGETFNWREYAFRAHFFSGQTDLHAAYQATVDGRHVLFSGDNFYPPQQWGGTGGLSGLNGGHPTRGWRRSIDLVIALEPEWVLASHIQPFPYRRDDFLACRDWTETVAAAMRDLAPDGCLERHHDPHWISLTPYAQSASSPTPVTARLQNPYPHPVTAEVRLALPERWSADDVERHLSVPAGGEATADWSVIPQPSARTEIVTLDVTWNGEYLGEIAECYVRPA